MDLNLEVINLGWVKEILVYRFLVFNLDVFVLHVFNLELCFEVESSFELVIGLFHQVDLP